MSTTVPSRDEIFNAFEFTQADIQIAPIRPSGVTIQKLIKGFYRNARNQYSSRKGCRGADTGHKWICMTVQDWNTEQAVLATPAFDPVHLAWQTLFDLEGLNPSAAWLTANPEPLITTYMHPYPEIENPGEMDNWTGTAAQLAVRQGMHQAKERRFQLETNVHRALKHLFTIIVPKDLYSDKIGDEDNIDLFSISALLDHLNQKYNKTTPKECDKIHALFGSPMGDLTPEQYFGRQKKCQKKLQKTKVPLTDDAIMIKAIVHFNQIPWMQNHVTDWEETEDPQGLKTLPEFQAYFIKYASRHHSNQEELKEAGIVNNVEEAATKNELAAARATISSNQATISSLQNQVADLPRMVELMVNNATMANNSNSGASLPSQIILPRLPQANQVDNQSMLREMQSMMDKKFAAHSNNNTSTNTNTSKPTNCTGRVYGAYCPNCGVMLLPNKCATGCVRIKKGHTNIPFPNQAIANTINFENRHNHPGASNNKAAKYGKKWEEVTDPRVLARL